MIEILIKLNALDSLDSTFIQFSLLQNTIDSPPSSTISIWIPLLSAIVGGILVLAGQKLDRNSRQKNIKKDELRNIYSNCRRLEALMKNNYRELALAKTHVEYWWYCHSTTNGENEKARYYEEHLRSQAMAREVERKIGETKADFIGYVRKFQALKALKLEIESQLAAISELSNKRAKDYPINLFYETVRDGIGEDERELREFYYLNLSDFKSINEYLQQQL